jgi:hypothetical protein
VTGAFSRTSTPREVRKLERDVARPDEGDAPRQRVELQELGARPQVFLAREVEPPRLSPTRDQEVRRLELTVTLGLTDHKAVHAGEPGHTVEGGDAGLLEGRLATVGDRVGEGALEAHERRPVEARLAWDAPADQHLLGITPAQWAGAAIRLVVHHRDPPPRLTAAVRGSVTGQAGTNDDQIE